MADLARQGAPAVAQDRRGLWPRPAAVPDLPDRPSRRAAERRRRFSRLKPLDIRAFLAARRMEAVQSRSLMRQLAALRSFARHLEREGHGTASAFAAIRTPEGGQEPAAPALRRVGGRGDRAETARRRETASPGSWPATPPCWRCSTARACASPRRSACSGGTRRSTASTSLTVTGKGGKMRSVPVIPPIQRGGRGIPALCPYAVAAGGTAVRRRARRPALAAHHPARGRGAARRARAARQRDAARPAPFLRDASPRRAAATCAASRNCWATPRCRRRSSTPRSTRRG